MRLTETLQPEAALNYERSIRTGFREVSDALVGYRKTTEQRTEQEQLVKALLAVVQLYRALGGGWQ